MCGGGGVTVGSRNKMTEPMKCKRWRVKVRVVIPEDRVTSKKFIVYQPFLCCTFCVVLAHPSSVLEKYCWQAPGRQGSLCCILESWEGQSVSVMSWQVHRLCAPTCSDRTPMSTPHHTPSPGRNILFPLNEFVFPKEHNSHANEDE